MQEQDIPIDINTSKLLDWLISRRHVNKDWQNNILKVRERINNAIQDMPEHEGIIKLLSGQHINYFHCLIIINILKETEAETKNLFGRYGSQRMKDWKDIEQLYQKDNLYLAEAAQMLIRNVNFEIPSLRKQITKFEQIQVESEKKIKDYTNTENITFNEFNATCKQMGISGERIKRELVDLLKELPKIYVEAAKKTKLIEDAIALYIAFIKFHSGDSNALSLLQYVVRNGNATTYEYIYGEKPISIEEPPISITDYETEIKKKDEIDFGEEIDFGDGITMEKTEIDWGTLSPTDDSFEIIEHTDLDVNLEESGIVVEKSGNDGGVARGAEALTILDNPKTREQFLNDVVELEAFLGMRLFEMSQDSDLLSLSQMQDVPTILQMQTIEGITAMMDSVGIVLNEFLNKRTQHLHNIKHSPKYVDMLTASLNQKLAIVERLKTSKKVMQEKIENARVQIQNVQPTIDLMIKNAKILREQIEEDISKKYKGRPVHIVGAVNML